MLFVTILPPIIPPFSPLITTILPHYTSLLHYITTLILQEFLLASHTESPHTSALGFIFLVAFDYKTC